MYLIQRTAYHVPGLATPWSRDPCGPHFTGEETVMEKVSDMPTQLGRDEAKKQGARDVCSVHAYVHSRTLV